jgi:hypothetical protein
MSEIDREPIADELPPKPEVENMPPEEGNPPPEEEDEDPITFLKKNVARQDETIDDEESESYPE